MQNTDESVIRQYSGLVYRLAYARAGNRQDADEIYQEVFFRYLKKHPVLENETHAKAWFIRVTVNCANSLWRSPWKRYAELTENDLILESRETIDLSHALKKLPPSYREVIHLFYYEDLSTDEISRILKRKKSTVRAQLTRARQLLKKLLKEYAYEF